VFFAAAVGTTTPGTAGQPTATGTRPTTATTTPVSVLSCLQFTWLLDEGLLTRTKLLPLSFQGE